MSVSTKAMMAKGLWVWLAAATLLCTLCCTQASGGSGFGRTILQAEGKNCIWDNNGKECKIPWDGNKDKNPIWDVFAKGKAAALDDVIAAYGTCFNTTSKTGAGNGCPAGAPATCVTRSMPCREFPAAPCVSENYSWCMNSVSKFQSVGEVSQFEVYFSAKATACPNGDPFYTRDCAAWYKTMSDVLGCDCNAYYTLLDDVAKTCAVNQTQCDAASDKADAIISLYARKNGIDYTTDTTSTPPSASDEPLAPGTPDSPAAGTPLAPGSSPAPGAPKSNSTSTVKSPPPPPPSSSTEALSLSWMAGAMFSALALFLASDLRGF